MKIYKLLILTLLFGGFFTSCSKDGNDTLAPVSTGKDTSAIRDLTVEHFIYRGMNNIYLYKANIPQLADNYFATQSEKDAFLSSFATPEKLFYDGLVDSKNDRFSFLVDDYVYLENLFSGITKTSGMHYGLMRYSSGSSEIFGYVRYVEHGSPAEEAGLKRGDIFTEIDGKQLTDTNYSDLLGSDSFTLSLANIDGNTISKNGETVSLTKVQFNSNPVYIAKTLDDNGTKVGYLKYNAFVADYDPQLNDAFAQFKADGITQLVLDLRYNGGGSVRTATDLAAMITGQFAGKIFTKEEWNADYEAYFEQNKPERLLNKFNTSLSTGEAINSLNLSKVYILTSSGTASASELVINGLKPYIDVVQIGETTTGKFQASVTLYDSPNFGRQNANPNHTYAIQPLVLKSSNANGVTDYVNGLAPTIPLQEDIRNLGTLGDPNEPLLKVALDDIAGNHRAIDNNFKTYPYIGESGMHEPIYQKMYIDKLPEIKQ